MFAGGWREVGRPCPPPIQTPSGAQPRGHLSRACGNAAGPAGKGSAGSTEAQHHPWPGREPADVLARTAMTEACLSGPSPCLRSSAWLIGEQSQGWAMGPMTWQRKEGAIRDGAPRPVLATEGAEGAEASGIHCPLLHAQSLPRAGPAAGRQTWEESEGPLGPGGGPRIRRTAPPHQQASSLLCPTSQRNCLLSGGGRPLRRGLPWVSISAPWRVLRVSPRGPGGAHLWSWVAREGEPHFLSQRDPREMRPQRPRAQESLMVGAAGRQ